MTQSLDPSQNKFVIAPSGHTRLLAPAGCGKTLSLLFRCLHLFQTAAPQKPRFLLVTFTVAARHELAARISQDVRFAGIRDHVELATLNSWGYRRIRASAFSPKLITGKKDYHFAMLNQLQPIWRKHEAVATAIERSKHKTPRGIMDLMDAFKSLGFDHKRHLTAPDFATHLDWLCSNGLASRVDQIRDRLAALEVLRVVRTASGAERAEAGVPELYERFYKFWGEATQHLFDSATFTFEDQKYFAYLDERQKLEDGKFLSGVAKYDHVMVDEFQDINPLDLALLRAIASRSRSSITIVGDDDQAIFEWRGATPEYILNPDAHLGVSFATYTLEVNYRSPRNVVMLSQRLISYNTRRVPKNVRASRQMEATIVAKRTENFQEAMDLVCSEVQRSLANGQSPSQVALISRKRSQLIPYQIQFASQQMSFCAAEDLQVFMSDAFDRILSLLAMKMRASTRQTRTQTVLDALDLCGLVKRFPLSKGDREALRGHLVSSAPSTLQDAANSIAEFRGTLKGDNAGGRMSRDMSVALMNFCQTSSVAAAINSLADDFQGLHADLGKAEDDIFYADPPFLHLSEYAMRYGNDYGRFLDDVALAKDQLTYVPPFEEDSSTAPVELWRRPLHLMTALRAKGKEFGTVILLDVNDGIWPSKHAKTPHEYEAERRVMYVAFTRARERVLLQVARRISGREAAPSPFLGELGVSIP